MILTASILKDDDKFIDPIFRRSISSIKDY